MQLIPIKDIIALDKTSVLFILCFFEVEVLAKSKKQSTIKYDILGILLILSSIYLYICLFSKDPGYVGKLIGNVVLGVFGLGAYVFPILVTILGIAAIYMKDNMKLNLKFYAFCIFLTAVLIMLFVQSFSRQTIYGTDESFIDIIVHSYQFGAVDRMSGGVLGGMFGFTLLKLFGYAATIAIVICLFVIAILMFTETPFRNILEFFKNGTLGLLVSLKSLFKRNKDKREQELFAGADKQVQKQSEIEAEQERIKEMDKKIKILDFTKNFDKEFKTKEPIQQSTKENDVAILEKHRPSKESIQTAAGSVGSTTAGSVGPTTEAKTRTANIKEVKEARELEEQNITNLINHINKHFTNYKLPPTKLLNFPADGKGTNTKKEVMNNVKILEDTLKNFGVSASISQVSVGPTITRYELQLSPGVKVSKITNLADDISLSLASSGIRIEAPIPGKAAVGIEVPNKDITTVFLREVLESEEFANSKSKISFGIGKDVAGANIVADLSKMPHLLIAGATGSGKSVCVNTLIASILYKASPDEVKLLMIDPKVVELSVYKNIPHLLVPVVTDPKKAAGALNWAVTEMTERYKRFAANNVRDITGYNSINKENHEKLPQIVVIIDELADLMMVSPGDVEDSICRLAQMARAAGIHLVVATQRPSVDVITGLIKANIPSRISFAVSSQVDSRTILDMAGAEKLLGKGDMLFYPVGESKPVRVQGAFVSEKEVEKLVEFIRDQVPPIYNDAIIKELENSVIQESEDDDEDSDEMLPQAIEMVVESGQASILMLQRRLKIGYNRAARLIDQMEERRIIGGYEGSKPRKVLISREQLEEMM